MESSFSFSCFLPRCSRRRSAPPLSSRRSSLSRKRPASLSTASRPSSTCSFSSAPRPFAPPALGRDPQALHSPGPGPSFSRRHRFPAQAETAAPLARHEDVGLLHRQEAPRFQSQRDLRGEIRADNLGPELFLDPDAGPARSGSCARPFPRLPRAAVVGELLSPLPPLCPPHVPGDDLSADALRDLLPRPLFPGDRAAVRPALPRGPPRRPAARQSAVRLARADVPGLAGVGLPHHRPRVPPHLGNVSLRTTRDAETHFVEQRVLWLLHGSARVQPAVPEVQRDSESHLRGPEADREDDPRRDVLCRLLPGGSRHAGGREDASHARHGAVAIQDRRRGSVPRRPAGDALLRRVPQLRQRRGFSETPPGVRGRVRQVLRNVGLRDVGLTGWCGGTSPPPPRTCRVV